MVALWTLVIASASTACGSRRPSRRAGAASRCSRGTPIERRAAPSLPPRQRPERCARLRAGWRARVAGLGLLAASPERGDPVARRSSASARPKYWDLVATFDSAASAYGALHAHATRVPGERNALAFGARAAAGSAAVSFQNGRRAGDWTLAEDGHSIEIGSSLLASTAERARLEVDNDKQGVKVYLDAVADAARAPVPELPERAVDVLQLATPVRAASVHAEWEPLHAARPRRHRPTPGWTSPSPSRCCGASTSFGRDGDVGSISSTRCRPTAGDASRLDGRAGRKARRERDGGHVSLGDGEMLRGCPIPRSDAAGRSVRLEFRVSLHLGFQPSERRPASSLPTELPEYGVSLRGRPHRELDRCAFRASGRAGPWSTTLRARAPAATA